ncbi:hypothetical protein WA026_009415 [Henosepilachna vigintioctopunctata]|uniref:BHLH domain-containing protein n=1 Tax=Henosepilachna vigintioctopunctata TaxID=420089 RepID=A0AAW1U4J4_9CUCU
MDSLLQKYSDLSERLASELSSMGYTDSNNNENSECYEKLNLVRGEKYSLRPRSSRRFTEVEETAKIGKKTQKSCKQKPAPLSKYRRKTANARERNRMREINQAFETLRAIIPHGQVHQASGANEKLTKITTLRLAMRYINTLSSALNCSDNNEDFCFNFDSCRDLDCLMLESDGESLSLSENSFLASPEFPESSLSPVDFADSGFPTFLHTDFTDQTLGSSDFENLLFS